jgi:hypothetical protein
MITLAKGQILIPVSGRNGACHRIISVNFVSGFFLF